MAHDLKALTRRWFDEVWNRGHEPTIDELFLPTGVAGGLGDEGRQLLGPAGFREFYGRMRGAFSDIHIDIEDVVADGDTSAARYTFTATHTGDAFGVPATGKTVRTTGQTFIHWKDGRIVRGWNEFDVATLSAQIHSPPAVKVRA